MIHLGRLVDAKIKKFLNAESIITLSNKVIKMYITRDA